MLHSSWRRRHFAYPRHHDHHHLHWIFTRATAPHSQPHARAPRRPAPRRLGLARLETSRSRSAPHPCRLAFPPLRPAGCNFIFGEASSLDNLARAHVSLAAPIQPARPRGLDRRTLHGPSQGRQVTSRRGSTNRHTAETWIMRGLRRRQHATRLDCHGCGSHRAAS